MLLFLIVVPVESVDTASDSAVSSIQGPHHYIEEVSNHSSVGWNRIKLREGDALNALDILNLVNFLLYRGR
jgi:hypothetical protein